MTPNWHWTLRQITLYLYNNCPRVSNFTPFRSTTSRFWVAGHIEPRAPNDLKMTLNTTRSKVHHICVTSVPARVPKFWSVLLYDRFHDIELFIIPNWLSSFCGENATKSTKKKERKKDKCQKSKIWNLTILYTSLVETLPRSMHELLGVFSEEMSFEDLFSRMVPC